MNGSGDVLCVAPCPEKSFQKKMCVLFYFPAQLSGSDAPVMKNARDISVNAKKKRSLKKRNYIGFFRPL
jgi:hypothetical protein